MACAGWAVPPIWIAVKHVIFAHPHCTQGSLLSLGFSTPKGDEFLRLGAKK